jgi:glycosyltransferase involved in cell wall biosynthesis
MHIMHSDCGDRPIRILSVCETARGGVGVYQNILLKLQEAGFGLHVIAPRQHADIFAADLEITTFDSPKRSVASILRMVRCFARTRLSLKPDIYFFHSTLSLASLAFLRAIGDRSPAVYCAHGWAVCNYDPKSIKSRVVRLIEGRLCGLADTVINVSNFEMETALEFGYSGNHVILENAVFPPAAEARDDLFVTQPDALHLLFVGRFDRQKGLDKLLKAFAEARRNAPNLHLHVIGAAVRESSTVHELPEGVSMVGWIDAAEIDDWYRSADALVVPSRWEAFGLVIPEALRNGTPVLCARRGGMPSLVDDGKTGMHFDLEISAMARMLAGLDRNQLRAMRDDCLLVYEKRFALRRLVEQLAKLLLDLKEKK